MSVTICDIAERAGIHPGTVSRALNGDPRVRQSTRERILAVATELGYVTNRNARNLVAGKTSLICLAVGALNQEHVSAVADALNRRLAERGYTLMVLIHNNKDEQFKRCLGHFLQKLCDGAILFSPQSRFEKLPELATLRASGFPLLCLDQWLPNLDFPAVTCDATRAIELLTEHMLAFGMDAAYLYFPSDNTVARARKEAASKLLRQKGIRFITNEDDPSRFLAERRSRVFGIYADSPDQVSNLFQDGAVTKPEICLGAMFDSWKFNAPPFFQQIFLCIQDLATEGAYAADVLLKALEGAPLPQGVQTFPPKEIIVP